jgi:cobalt-zinc-cadmium efflux system membrane fusion protein
MKTLTIFSITAVVYLLTACSADQGKQQVSATGHNDRTVKLTAQQLAGAGITTGIPEQRQISSILRVSGRIDMPPQNVVSVSVPLGGYVKWTNLLPGMQVTKGQVIAKVEDPLYIQLQQDYLTAGAKLRFLEAEYVRQKELNNSKAVSDKVFQQAEAEYKAEKILLRSLCERLKLTGMDPGALNENNLSRILDIRAPITGFVSAANVNTGRYVNPSDVLFELIDPKDIHLVLTVFEKDLGKVSVGQKLRAYNNNDPATRYDCRVILVSRSLSEERSGEVHCHFEKYNPELVPGMFMNGEIQVRAAKVTALPEDAVVSFENRQYVFVQKGAGEFEMTEVTTGTSEDGFTEIVSFVGNAQDTVVVKGAYTLLMTLKNRADG